jgi:cytidylate kinase
MWSLFVYGEKFTDTQEISKKLALETGLMLVTDKDVIRWTAKRFSIRQSKLSRVFEKKSFFESLTHAKQRAMAYLKCVLAETLEKQNSVYMGLNGHLFPEKFSLVYRIFVTADTNYRIQKAFLSDQSLPEKQAIQKINHEDEKAFRWCRRIYNHENWDTNSYQMVLPTQVLDKSAAVQMVLNKLPGTMQAPDQTARQTLKDFQLAAKVEVLLAEKGFPVTIRAKDNIIFVTIEKPVLRLSKLSEKITQTVSAVKGVKTVKIGVGRNFNQADLCCHTTYEIPIKTQLNQYASNHAQLRKRAISALSGNIRHASRPALSSHLHLNTMG